MRIIRIRQPKLLTRTSTLFLTILAGICALCFLIPTLLTISSSLMSQSELAANYGQVFASVTDRTTFVSKSVTLKLIPDIVSFSQYTTVLIRSPEYLLKFWNSVILVVPIVLFQLFIAAFASYSFSQFRGKIKEIIFFIYIILMLMPYQVTLVPNYLISQWLNILNTRWAIILPGIFAPFSVFILTKYMRRIPIAMIEASKLDGAGHWQIFTQICIPLCKSALYSIMILVFIDYWNMVEQPLILLTGEATAMHPLSVYLSKINAGEVGVAFAVATVYMIPCILIFLYGEEYLIDGIAYAGGIKG